MVRSGKKASIDDFVPVLIIIIIIIMLCGAKILTTFFYESLNDKIRVMFLCIYNLWPYSSSYTRNISIDPVQRKSRCIHTIHDDMSLGLGRCREPGSWFVPTVKGFPMGYMRRLANWCRWL